MDLAATLGKSLNQLALLPLEIRNSKSGDIAGRTIVRSLTKELETLGQGEWVLTLTLPTGKHLSTIVTTDPEGRIDTADLVAKLASSAAEMVSTSLPAVARIGRNVSKHPWIAKAGLPRFQEIDWKGLAGNLAGRAVNMAIGHGDDVETAVPPSSYGSKRSLRHPDAQLHFFRGSVLTGDVTEVAAGDIKVERANGSVQISDPEQKLLIIQLLRPDLPPNNLLLPPAAALRLSLRRQGDSDVVVAVTFGDPLADQAVGFRARANVSDLATVADHLTAEDVGAFAEKPVGAAVCLLYLILNEKDPETVELALRSLPEQAIGSPDAMVVKAELAARFGQTQAALRGFLDAAGRGLPWFGRGISYLVDRLGLYEKMLWAQRTNSSASGSPSSSDDDGRAIEQALDALRPFARNANYSAPVTTYNGVHPVRPGSASITRSEFLSAKGFPISLS